MKSKFIVMGIIAVILSCGAFYISVMASGGETPSMTPANIWNMAQKENGFKYGGIIGSYLGWIIFKVFSKVGTPIVLGAALIVMCIFLFDVKPDTAWRFVKRVSKFIWKWICKLAKMIYYKITKKETAHGKIFGSWTYLDSGKVRYELTVPNGTLATVRIDGMKERRVTGGSYTLIL